VEHSGPVIGVEITVPKFNFKIGNTLEVIEAMTSEVAGRVKFRASRGLGPEDRLPAPKDGGRPIHRTGQLVASIGYVVRTMTPKGKALASPVGVVRATGRRVDAGDPAQYGRRRSRQAPREYIARKARAARARTKQLREDKVARVMLSPSAEEQAWMDRVMATGRRSRAPKSLGLGKIRVRTAETNAGLVAILRQPPRDKRARSGNRERYVIIAANEMDMIAAKLVAKRVARPELTTNGKIAVGA
jgi:hypothetical protein